MEKLEILNESRVARHVYEATKRYLDEHKKSLLDRLLAETRTGPIDPQTYAKYLGGISALDELEVALKKTILKGEKTERELLDAATRSSRN